jgi:hypothetical protein
LLVRFGVGFRKLTPISNRWRIGQSWWRRETRVPEIVYETLIGNATPLPPGGRIETNTFDVNGARAVSVNVGIISHDAQVSWGIYFGPTTNNAFAPARQGSFYPPNSVSVHLPVFAPQMLIIVENHGPNATNCDGTLYFIRDLP